MKLTAENYYSPEANKAYWSASFVKEMLDCPNRAMGELDGTYQRGSNAALLVGSFVDSYFEGEDSFAAFIEQHPEIINSRTGEFKADFNKALLMIARAKADPVFMEFMRGEKQKIFTGEIGGIPFKCKLDVYLPGERIVDLKTVKDFEPMYRKEEGRLSFAEYWRWPLQMAIYQHLEGNKLPCYLACITKQDPPDIQVVEIPQHILDTEMEILLEKLPYLDAIRQGIIEPDRCESCAHCRNTRKLSGAISLDDITNI